MSLAAKFENPAERGRVVMDVAENGDFIIFNDRKLAAKVSDSAYQSEDADERVLTVDGPRGGQYVIREDVDPSGGATFRYHSATNPDDTRTTDHLQFAPTPDAVTGGWGDAEKDDDVGRWFDHRWDDVAEEMEARGVPDDGGTQADADPLDEPLDGEPQMQPAESPYKPDFDATDVDFSNSPDPVVPPEQQTPAAGHGEFPSMESSDDAEDMETYIDRLSDEDNVSYNDLLSEMGVDPDYAEEELYVEREETPHTFVDELLAWGHNVPRVAGNWVLVDYGIVWPEMGKRRKLVWENRETLEIVALVAARADNVISWNVYYIEEPTRETTDPVLITDDADEAIDQVVEILYGRERNIEVEIIERKDGSVDIVDRVDRETIGRRILQRLGIDRTPDVDIAARAYDWGETAAGFMAEHSKRITDFAVMGTIAWVTSRSNWAATAAMTLRKVLDDHQLELRGRPIVQTENEIRVPLRTRDGIKIKSHMVDSQTDEGHIVIDPEYASGGVDGYELIEIEGEAIDEGDDGVLHEVYSADPDEGEAPFPSALGVEITGQYTYAGKNAPWLSIEDKEFSPSVVIDTERFDLSTDNTFRRAAWMLENRGFDEIRLPILNAEYEMVDTASSGGTTTGSRNLDDIARWAQDQKESQEDDDADTLTAAERLSTPSWNIPLPLAIGTSSAFGERILSADELKDEIRGKKPEEASEILDKQAAMYAAATFVKWDKSDNSAGWIKENRNKFRSFIGERNIEKMHPKKGDADHADAVEDVWEGYNPNANLDSIVNMVEENLSDILVNAGDADEAIEEGGDGDYEITGLDDVEAIDPALESMIQTEITMTLNADEGRIARALAATGGDFSAALEDDNLTDDDQLALQRLMDDSGTDDEKQSENWLGMYADAEGGD